MITDLNQALHRAEPNEGLGKMLTANKTTIPAITAALFALVLTIVLALTTNAGLFVANIWTI